MKRQMEITRRRVRIKEVNSVIAYAASMMLNGVPPLVCESVLDELYGAVRKSLGRVRG